MLIKTNSSWLIFELIKDLEINSSSLFDLDFDNDTILSHFFFFFLIIYLYFLNPAVVAQIFNPIAELEISMGIPIKEEKPEMETHPVIVEAKIKKFLNII